MTGMTMTNGNNAMAVDMGLMEALNQYKDNISVYPTNRKDKNGVEIYGIAFYFDNQEDVKARKVFTGKSNEELYGKRVEFLTDLYHQKKVKRESEKQIAVKPETATIHHPIVSIPSKITLCDKTLTQAIDDFMVGYEPTVSGATIEAEKSNNNKIKMYLGKKLVTDISFNDYQNMVNEASKGKDGVYAAKKTIMNLKTSFNRIMRYCMKQKWISLEDFTLITTDVKIPSYTREYDNTEKFLEYEEIGEILRALDDTPKYYITARILLLTGMRQEEFYALEKSDLFREHMYIDINKAMTKNKNRKKGERIFVLGPTKNTQSTRKVPAIEEVFYWFDKLEKWMIESGNRKKAKARGNGNFIITDRNGNLVDEHSFITNLNRCLKDRPDIDFTLGMARHCYQTYLDDLDANRHDVDVAVGHKLVGVGDKYYRAIRTSYMRRLYPDIEKMANEIERAYKIK